MPFLSYPAAGLCNGLGEGRVTLQCVCLIVTEEDRWAGLGGRISSIECRANYQATWNVIPNAIMDEWKTELQLAGSQSTAITTDHGCSFPVGETFRHTGMDFSPNYNNNSSNNQIYIAPYGRNFRGAGGRSDQCSVKASVNKKF